MVATSKEALDHLLTEVLQLGAEDVEALDKQLGLKYMQNFSRLDDNDLVDRKDQGVITSICCTKITDFKMSYTSLTTSLTTTQVMAMTPDTWDAVNVSILRINRALAETALAAAPELGITADTVTPTQIKADSFLKYCNIKLPDKSGIVKFYDNIVTQATCQNIFLRPSDEITPTAGVKPDGMQPRLEAIMTTALHSKFSQDGVIYPTYTAAHNLLATTTSGYVFLQLLMQQSHVLLAIKNIATIDIPKYTDFNDIFRYVREVTVYVEAHKLRQRIYTEKETTHIFLSHLDDEHYTSLMKNIESSLLLSPVGSADYLVPEIAGTLDQLAPRKSRPTNTPRPRHSDPIHTIEDYSDDDTRDIFNTDNFCEYIDKSGESPHIRSFRDGGGRPPNKRGYGRKRGRRYRNRTYNQPG